MALTMKDLEDAFKLFTAADVKQREKLLYNNNALYQDLEITQNTEVWWRSFDAVYRWIVIGNQNPVWEILDLQLEQQPVVDDTVTDVVFD